jgi:hypothetical protein
MSLRLVMELDASLQGGCSSPSCPRRHKEAIYLVVIVGNRARLLIRRKPILSRPSSQRVYRPASLLTRRRVSTLLLQTRCVLCIAE